MNGRTWWRVVLAIALVFLIGAVAVGAYQAGVSTAVVQSGAPAGAAPYAYYGWHPFGFGFGLFGFLGTLLFLILIFALIRAVVFGGRRGGWGHGPRGRWDGHGDRWSGAHDVFETWHREAHGDRPVDRPADRPVDRNLPPS